MFCKQCGSQNADGVRFCTNCGAELTAEQPATYNAYPQNNPYNNVQPQNAQPASQPGKGLAIAALVCGIVSFFCFSIILGPLAVIFGAVAKGKGCRSGMATAGIVCGVISVALWIILMAAGVDFLSDLTSSYYYSYY